MKKTKAFLKIGTLSVVIISYFLIAFALWPFFKIAPQKTRKILNRLIQICALLCTKGLSISYKVTNLGENKSLRNENYFIVANHVSYTDILVLSGILPSSFVTSMEMKETFFLGQVVTLAGCLFVERRSRDNLTKETQDITDGLENSINVIVFPEASSFDGSQIERFRKPLFQAAINSGKAVLPICINYVEIDNEPVTIKNRDSVFWYGEMTFFPHLIKLAQLKSIKAEVKILEPIETNSSMTTTELAKASQNAIEKHFVPIVN